MVADAKGWAAYVTQHVSQFIKDCGLTHFAYRSDREPSILLMLEEAVQLSGRNGEKIGPNIPATPTDPVPSDIPSAENTQLDPSPSGVDSSVLAVPEHSHPGESASNGKGRTGSEIHRGSDSRSQGSP